MRTNRPGLGVLAKPGAPKPNRLGVLGGASLSALGSAFDDNMAAIVDYINRTPTKTPEAARIKDEFAKWYNGISYWDDEQITYDKARNYRNSFNLANAVTSSEKQTVERVIKTGLTTEEAAGESARARTTSGQYAVPDEPLVPTWKWAVVGVVAIGGLYALGKVTTLAQLFTGKRKSGHAPNARRARRGGR